MLLPQKKYALAIHTSSHDLGLVISNFADDIRCQTWDVGRDLSVCLHQYLGEFMRSQTFQDLAFIAVAKGPGGFTGTRIGMVTARTIAQQLDIPLFAVSSLAAIAGHVVKAEKSQNEEESLANISSNIAVQMQAGRGQLFGAIYAISRNAGLSLSEQLPDTVMTPETWEKTLKNWETPVELVKAEGGLGETVLELLELAYLDWQNGKRSHWSEALPFYGQHPVDLKF